MTIRTFQDSCVAAVTTMRAATMRMGMPRPIAPRKKQKPVLKVSVVQNARPPAPKPSKARPQAAPKPGKARPQVRIDPSLVLPCGQERPRLRDLSTR